MRKKYEWERNENGEVVNQNGEWISGNSLAKEHHEFASSPDKSYREKYLQEAIEYVLCKNGVEYVSEYLVNDKDHAGRRADIYIPATDTAIELKKRGNTKGLGQAAYYAQYHKESLLLCEKYTEDIAEAIRSIPATHHGTVMPGVHHDTPVLSISSDSRCDFFRAAKHGGLGSFGCDWFVKKPAYNPGKGRVERELSAFEREGV